MKTPLQKRLSNPRNRLLAQSKRLAEALNDAMESLKRCPDGDKAFRVTCIAQAKKALLAAGYVEDAP